jgi:hypothetical protein
VRKPSSTLADILWKRFKALEITRKRVELLCKQNRLNLRDAERMYEGLFLSAHVAFEGFLEDLFIGLLIDGDGYKSSRSDVGPRVIVKSFRVARDLLQGRSGKGYIDWFPYKRTIELAEIYFRGGRPFSDLDDAQKEILSKCHIIRNVIAHKSRYSLDKFNVTVLASTPLPPLERSPAGYLRGIFRVWPIQTRYENLIAQLLIMSRHLAR